MVIHFIRIAPSRKARKPFISRPGLPAGLAFNSTTPSSGANSTATIQDRISAMALTAKMEKVYSPAELLAKPIGTNPAAVTNEPVSIGKARVL